MNINQCELSEYNIVIKNKPNIFILCASYEDRCKSVADKVDLDYISKVLLIQHIDCKSQKLEENVEYLRNKFSDRIKIIEVDSSNPLTIADRMKEALYSNERSNNLNYLIDITTFTHESLLILFGLLLSIANRTQTITFIYTGAKEYCSGKKTEDKWLSKGIKEIRSILGFPGEIDPSKKNQLIILVGYEHERASILIKLFEPNKISLGRGKAGSATSDKNYEVNLYFHKLLAETVAQYGPISNFEFSCNDPTSAKEDIIQEMELLPDYNHIIAPMNTKLSTLAAALVSIQFPSTQLCYAQPLLYNYDNYSIPGKNCYIAQMKDLLR